VVVAALPDCPRDEAAAAQRWLQLTLCHLARRVEVEGASAAFAAGPVGVAVAEEGAGGVGAGLRPEEGGHQPPPYPPAPAATARRVQVAAGVVFLRSAVGSAAPVSAALSGVGGVMAVAGRASGNAWAALRSIALSWPGGARLPVLLLAPSQQAAREWEEHEVRAPAASPIAALRWPRSPGVGQGGEGARTQSSPTPSPHLHAWCCAWIATPVAGLFSSGAWRVSPASDVPDDRCRRAAAPPALHSPPTRQARRAGPAWGEGGGGGGVLPPCPPWKDALTRFPAKPSPHPPPPLLQGDSTTTSWSAG
jgi:hypothetical protein